MNTILVLLFLSLFFLTSLASAQDESKKESMQVTAKRIKQGSAKALLDERRSSSEVKDVISSEQISKSGDSDAGAAMRRVTGLTLIGGKSIYVRGLGERYSATTLNGLNVPSPDPARRQVQFDLFPAEVLESIVVQKSYSPDLPGEFGGGAALLRTKSIPTRFEGRVSLGTGYTTDKVNTYEHSNTDWLGFDDGTRSLPTALKEQSLTQTSGLTGDQREALTEAFPRIYSVQEESAPINRSFSASLGDRIPIGSTPLGYSVGVTYGDEWNRYDREQNEYTSDLNTVVKGKRGDVSEREVKLGGIGVLSADIGGSQLRGLIGVLHKTTDAVDISDSFNLNTTANNIRSTRLQWQERDLLLRQLFGEHNLAEDGSLKLSWRVGLNKTTRKIPDQRSYGYNDRGDSLVHDQSDISRLRRKWFDNEEDMQEVQLDLAANVYTGDEHQFDIKTGVLGLKRERKSGAREFFFTPAAVGSPAAALGESPLEEIYTPENIRFNETQGQGFLLAEEVTLPSDTYTADQDLQGAYGMLQYKYIDGVEVTTGVRREMSKQNVDSIDSFDSRDPYKKAELQSNAVLPVLNATWAFVEGQQLRFAYSRTVARPDFRELSVSSYFDYERGIDIKGNPDLQFSKIDNYDLRWELYQNNDDYISFGLFHKSINKPIEQIPASNDGANTSAITYTNAERARNYGYEFETTQRLGAFSVGGNYSRIFSDITAPSDENSIRYTNTNRPMQGSAPYVLNVNTGYRLESTGSEANVVYNRVGERIMEAGIVVGENAVPDVKDVPMDSLDMVLSQALAGNSSVRFRARNLLGRDIEYKVGDRLIYRRTQDASYSVSISSMF
ncbi:MAG TPA: TonB-dependent receptor [Oligoflexus sp.]|uniref:TonB-dependent receptor domain-containing protein n=1 Tax=Oligoflexus sp. TaxID=1971216 RepID=UPI002D71D816|nr:TonB-dependent receptor [Oligoflexus sp.]HYX34300.1 TonB-dependent receptor [Oligoflexus sp.]